MAWMIYGANGYTGQLIAQAARERGEAPILAGRSADRIGPLAQRLSLPFRAFPVEQPDLSDVALVLHCAGPFSATSRPMVEACLRAGAHYLDITGEIEVFEAVFARDEEARARGVVLLPGTGFDVVPSDCLAASLKRRLPSATKLELAIAISGLASPGTLKTSIEALPRGGMVRRAGQLVRVPSAYEVREIPFADKPRIAMSIPWGDVSSAFRSTGIPDITVFMAARRGVIRAARLTRFTAPLLALPVVQQFLKATIDRNVRGPGPRRRARGGGQLWGRASEAARSAEMTMTVPDGYTLTVAAALECARRVLAGAVQPGAWTPAQAFGADFAASLPGVRVGDR